MVELADIFNLYGQKYIDKFKERILPSHLKAIEDIKNCCTEAMGGHLYFCDKCEIIQYILRSKRIIEKLNSQEKRQFTCPKCGKPLKYIGRIPKIRRAPP